MLRMVRDIFHISGFLGVDVEGHIVQIGLNPAAPLASVLVDSLQELLAPAHMAVHLDKHLLAPKPWSLLCAKFRFLRQIKCVSQPVLLYPTEEKIHELLLLLI
jgi:hypothetical protein